MNVTSDFVITVVLVVLSLMLLFELMYQAHKELEEFKIDDDSE